MKKLLTATILFLLMVLCGGLLGCSGGSDTITGEVGVKKIIYGDNGLEEFTIKVIIDGTVIYFDLADMINARSGQLVDFGSDMSADELRQYFAVKMINDHFPSSHYGDWIRCFIYSQAGIRDGDGEWMPVGIRGAFDLYEDDIIYALVMMFEMYGVDVPDGPPPDDIC